MRELAGLHDSGVFRYADILGERPCSPCYLILTLVESEGVVSSESYRIPATPTSS